MTTLEIYKKNLKMAKLSVILATVSLTTAQLNPPEWPPSVSVFT